MYPGPKKDMDADIESQETEKLPEMESVEEKLAEEKDSGADDSVSSVPQSVTPGNYLQTGREKSGLNRARVGQSLGLTEKAVKSLETNDFDFFPGGVYVRGYLKNYAKLLGEDEGELIAIYDRYCADNQLDNGKSTADLSSMPASQANNKKIIALVIGVVVIAVVAIIIFSTSA